MHIQNTQFLISISPEKVAFFKQLLSELDFIEKIEQVTPLEVQEEVPVEEPEPHEETTHERMHRVLREYREKNPNWAEDSTPLMSRPEVLAEFYKGMEHLQQGIEMKTYVPDEELAPGEETQYERMQRVFRELREKYPEHPSEWEEDDWGEMIEEERQNK